MKPNPFHYLLLTLLVLTLAPAASAQSGAYTRPTVSRMLVNHRDGEDRRLAAEFAKLPKEEQLYHNAIDATAISTAKPRSTTQRVDGKDYYMGLSKAEVAEREREFTRSLNSLNVGLQQLSRWFNRKADGAMDMSSVHFRGEYNATDEALHTAAATKRGRNELRDMGEALIANTHLVLCDYTNLRYERSSDGKSHSYNSLIYMYVFRMADADKLVNAVYNSWIDEGDSPEAKSRKRASFDSIKVKLELVRTIRRNIGASSATSGAAALSADELYASMVRKCYYEAMDYLAKKDDNFGVQASVYSVSPITAKIGKKEGLKIGQRFGIYESVMRKDRVKQVRRGYALANDKITDNRRVTDGSTEPSRFLQVSGRRVEPGMTLRYRRYDLGITLMGAYGQSAAGQRTWQLRAESQLYGLGARQVGWYLFADLDNLSSSHERPLLAEIDYSLLPDSYVLAEQSQVKAYRVNFGFGRQYQLTRNVQLSPYAGVGVGVAGYATFVDSTEVNSDISLNLQSWSAKAGANLALNLYYPLQLVGGVYANANFSTDFSAGNDTEMEKLHENYKGSEYDAFAALRGKNYADYYKGLSSFSVAFFVGLRYTF